MTLLQQMIPWQQGKKMFGKDLVRLWALRNAASHMSERVSQMFKTFIQNQWHVAQFLLRVGSIWCKHELLAAWSGALSKTKLTTHWLLFPFGFFEWFFFLPSQRRRSDCHFVAASLERPSCCLCHVPLGNGLRWFPWKGGRCVLHLCLNSINLFGETKKKVWSWWALQRVKESHSQEIISDVLFRVDRVQGLPSLGSVWTGNFRPKANTEWFWGAKQWH